MEEVELRSLYNLLRRYRRLIFTCVAVSVVICTAITLLGIKREYTASSTLLYSQAGISSAAGSIAGSLGLPLSVAQTGPSAWFETILTSRKLARTMVRKYNLVPVLEAKDEYQAVRRLLDRIIITAKPEASAVLITVRMPGSPIKFPGMGIDRDRAALAATIANDLVDQLSQWMHTNDYQSSAKERRFIQNQLQTVLGQMTVTREQLQDTFKRTGVFAPSDQGQAWLQAMAQLETDIATTRSELKGTEIAQQAGKSPEEINRLAAAADAQQKGDALTGELRKQIADVEVRLRQEIEVNHKTEDHPDVAQLRQSLHELQSKLTSELKIAASMRDLQEKKLSTQLNLGESRWGKLQQLIRNLPTQGLEVEQLKQELQAQGDLVEMLEKQLILAQIAEQQQSQDFNVLDPAEAPHQPTSPSLFMGVAIGFAVGLILGLLLAGLHHLRQTVAEPKVSEIAA
jgi:uncharacterized protein involved in exopolysaccharide biosynthesis